MQGYAFRTEWLFWVFETVPMIGAIGVFIFYHPAKYLGRYGALDPNAPRWFRRRRGAEKAHGMEDFSSGSDRQAVTV